MSTIACVPAQTATPARTAWPIALPWAVMAIAFFAFVRDHLLILWQRPHYQFFPILLVGVILLAGRAWRQRGTLTPGRPMLAMLFFVGVWLLLVLSLMLGSRWLAMLTALLSVQAGLYAHGGWDLIMRFLPATLVACGLLPLPLGFDELLLQKLQRLTTAAASPLLDSLGVMHVAAGNVIEVEGRRLLVAEACSGIHSLVTTIGAVLFFGLWFKRGITHMVFLLFSAVGWVLAGNILRVTLVAYAFDQRGIDLSEGTLHELLGIAVFLLVLGLVASTDAFFRFGTFDEPMPVAADPEPIAGDALPENPPATPEPGAPPSWPRPCAPFVVLGFGALAIVQLLAGGTGITGWQDPAMHAQLSKIDESFLPKTWHHLKDRRYTASPGPGVNLGDSNHEWTYAFKNKTVSLSLAYPYAEWHELTDCYVSQGWHVATRVHLPNNVVRCELTQGLDRFGLLLFVVGDGQGEITVPEWPGVVGKIRGRSVAWHVAVKRMGDSVLGTQIPSVARWQLQLFVESPEPFSSEDRDTLVQVLAEASERVSNRLATFDGGAP